MSFASDIKLELLQEEMRNPCCVRAELCALVCFSGAVLPPGRVRISTENAAVAQRGYSLIKEYTGIAGEIVTTPPRGVRGKSTYAIEIKKEEDGLRLLSALGLLSKNGVSFRANAVEEACCRRAFLRGAFLGGGTVANPEKEYHMEITTPREGLSEDIVSMFSSFGLTARTCRRKMNYVVYFKSSEEIGDALNIIGAPMAYMEFTSVRILKERRNSVNRRVNCESANLDKTIDAGQTQLAAIRRLSACGKLSSLPDTLRETAEARIENPEATLSELAAILKISKSGAAHRMRKLLEISKTL
mgnify:CR=1 FL=1